MKMTVMNATRILVVGGALALLVPAGGCGKSGDEPASATGVSAEGEDHSGHDHGEGDHDHGDGESGGDHSGWWCVEHGVPEKVCSICSSKAADKFKEEGDWCEEHGRAKSQCFKCDPSKAEKFARLYEAKYGKQPPQATD